MLLLLLRLCITIFIAFLCGRLIAKLKLPSILGWLICAMILGPHAVSLINQELLDAAWYQNTIHVMECAVGLMIGTELVWKKIKRSGKAIVITTLTQSLGTFFLVSLVFGIVFYFSGIPLYLALIFGGIALATAPAPALSIVREFKTDGPVTKTLIPMAALDDIVGCVVFFGVISCVMGSLSAGQMPLYMIPLMVVLPLVIGIATGYAAGMLLKKERNDRQTLALLIALILATSGVGFFFNYVVMPSPVLNFEWAGEFDRGVHPEQPANTPQQTVITISRQHGSGGREIGKLLAQQLHIPFYDHELIDMAAQSSEIDPSYFETAEESDVGGLLHELSANLRHDLSVEDKAFLHQSKVIREVAEKGSCIIVGRCADYVLSSRPGVFKVFIYADPQSRMDRIQNVYKETNHPSLTQLKATDDKRASYYRYFTGKDFGSAENYDICLNSSALGIEECVRILKDHYLDITPSKT